MLAIRPTWLLLSKLESLVPIVLQVGFITSRVKWENSRNRKYYSSMHHPMGRFSLSQKVECGQRKMK